MKWPPDIGIDPYYYDDYTVIYHGDCRDILPLLPKVDLVLTDPVWPNAKIKLIGSDRPEALYKEMVSRINEANRLAIQLGVDVDPTMLSVNTARWPFLRVCWLEYGCASYKGRVLITGDVAYIYGVPPSTKVCHVMPGKCISTHRENRAFLQKTNTNTHPTARHIRHVRWLVRWFSEGVILDPFMGSGTTLRAAKDLQRRAIGIEIEKKYCDVAVERLRQEVLPL